MVQQNRVSQSYNRRSSNSHRGPITLLVVILLILGLLWLIYDRAAAPAGKAGSSTTSNNISGSNNVEPGQTATFDKSRYSLSNPSSLWVVVNKHRSIKPNNFKPVLAVPDVKLKRSRTAESMHVSAIAAGPLKNLFDGASAAGYQLMLSSGYRSYSYQVSVYGSEVKAYGQQKADAESARPGYSEHQTGLAADVAPASGKCDLSQCFGNTPEGKWLAGNAYRYGFIIRYPNGKQNITGYIFEPWHIRYVGTDLSQEMHQSGVQTLEEFFGLGAAANYN